MTERDLACAIDWLRHADRVCVLTGAGVSAESGIPTFRAATGLWEGHRIEDVASPEGFERDPVLVWQFYNARRANAHVAQPNPGHFALAAFEQRWGTQFTLVTQNVDGLHFVAGNRNVLELHGSLRRTRCTSCRAVDVCGLEPLGDTPLCSCCRGLLRPDIVWFGEALPAAVWKSAETAASQCDVLLVVGTSAVVHPAASLVPIAKDSRTPGARVIEVNLVPTEASQLADLGLYGPAGTVLPALVKGLEPPSST